jgi:nitrile hydratase accessory protein
VAGDLHDSLEHLMRSHSIEPGEVVFAEPWQARAFALVLALAERGHLNWEDFRRGLIEHIAKAERAAGAEGDYYGSWLKALEAQLGASSLATTPEIEQRAADLAANPPAPTKATSAGPIRIA